MPFVAGVDSSTQSTKVEIRDLDSGEVVASTSSPHPTVTPPCSEQDPNSWWGAFEHAWQAAMSELPDGSHVEAVSVAGQQHGMVALDADDRPVHPAKLWNDTESAPDAGWLIEQLGSAEAWADGTTAERWLALPGKAQLSLYEAQNPQQGFIRGKFKFPADGVLNVPNLTGGCTCNYMPVSQGFAPSSAFE